MNAGQAQMELTWDNLIHEFLLLTWKSQQVAYYISNQNLASLAHWAVDLLCGILKIAHQQWDHHNTVLHKLQPNQTKDLQLDKDIWLQYEQGCGTIPQASKGLLNCPIEVILGLPHNKKQQWLLSIKAAWQCQCLAHTCVAQAQWLLLAQFLVPQSQPAPNIP